MERPECDLCGSTDLQRRLMGRDLCRDHFEALMDAQPTDMLARMQERETGNVSTV